MGNTTTTTTAADADQTGSDAISRASFPRLDRRWKETPPPGLACHLRPDGRTDGPTEVCLRRRKRQREREMKRERVRSDLSVSLALFLCLAFSPSLLQRLSRPIFSFSSSFLFNFSYNFSLEMMIYFSCLERS